MKGDEICKWCGAFESDHDYEQRARYCYPTRIIQLNAEIERMTAALCEIANRASNMGDPDAAEWMPSIYKLACEAIGEDPWPSLRANGHVPETLTVSLSHEQSEEK